MLAFRLPVPPPQSLPSLRDPPGAAHAAHARLGKAAPEAAESPRSPGRDHLKELCGSTAGFLLASSPSASSGGPADGPSPSRPDRPLRFPLSYRERLDATSSAFASQVAGQLEQQESEQRLAESLRHDAGRLSLTEPGQAGGEASADPAPARLSDDEIVRPLSQLPDPQVAKESMAAFYLPIEPLLSIEKLFGDKESDEREQAALRTREAAKSVLSAGDAAPPARPHGADAAKDAARVPAARSSARGSPGGLARQALSCPALPREPPRERRRGAAARAERPPAAATSPVVRTVLPGGWTCQEAVQKKPAGSPWRQAGATRPGAGAGAAPRPSAARGPLGGSASGALGAARGALGAGDAEARPRLAAGLPELWEGRSGLASVRDLLDGYAANPLGAAARPPGGCGATAGARPGGGAAAALQERPDSRGLSGFLETYVERQGRIERILAESGAPSPAARQGAARRRELLAATAS